jgi:tetratricopeptide (TPR) repeat protein
MRAVCCVWVLSISAGALWAHPSVAAGPSPSPRGPARPEPAEAPITPEAKARAAAAYTVGVGHFKARRFEEAVAEFAKAYRIDPSPILVFNMARSFEELRRYPQAVTFYQRYLEGAPNAPDRAAVRETIVALEGLSAPSSPATPPPADRGPGPWPWVVFGTGVALVGVGIGFGVLAGDRADTLDKIEANPSNYTLSEWNAARDEGQSYALGADLMLGFGLAAAAGGLAWWILADDGATVALTPAPGGLGLVGTF